MVLPLKQNSVYLESEKKRVQNEEWAKELEEKLTFTVEKFEE